VGSFSHSVAHPPLYPNIEVSTDTDSIMEGDRKKKKRVLEKEKKELEKLLDTKRGNTVTRKKGGKHEMKMSGNAARDGLRGGKQKINWKGFRPLQNVAGRRGGEDDLNTEKMGGKKKGKC